MATLTKSIGLVLVSLVLVSSKYAQGPYVLTIHEIGLCPREEIGETGDDLQLDGRIHHQRGAKSPAFSGNATLLNNPVTVGNSMITTYVAKWDTVSGWRKNFAILRFGEACQGLKTYLKTYYKEFIESHAPGFPLECPIKEGTYRVNNVSLRYDGPALFPVMPYGRFRLDGVMHYMNTASKKIRGCGRFVVETTERLGQEKLSSLNIGQESLLTKIRQ
ncbi:uncharacterized protein LOC117642944 [Thrips palmi]|uniref:Uncharacterized protein LOC117642944 n=1 Tax=Thrips palmi TaxID=161013 RepID=A0A6P8YL20_THRPL|nr:uncharacterized protein LOC117642944 [Thrips palmi]